ncbi:MAG: PEP-CTERM sorting domain-containing protein [Myxococcota bacterium]|nr:PEP-CTERM sorting domain-containing protein [Myxococcota bacterium]
MGDSKRHSRRASVITAIVLAAWAAAPVQALQIDLDLGTLASDQGWSFLSSGASETSVFSTDGSQLLQDTLGVGRDYALYRMPILLDNDDPIELEFRARLDGTTELAGSGPGFYFAVFTGTERYSLVLEPGRIATLEGTNLGALNTEVFHDYELFVVPGVSFSLYVDAQLFAAGSASAYGASPTLEFGDGSFSQNASGALASYSFYQGAELLVPEPSTTLLLALGLTGLALMGRTRRPARQQRNDA